VPKTGDRNLRRGDGKGVRNCAQGEIIGTPRSAASAPQHDFAVEALEVFNARDLMAQAKPAMLSFNSPEASLNL
jgi:hypothetical protein